MHRLFLPCCGCKPPGGGGGGAAELARNTGIQSKRVFGTQEFQLRQSLLEWRPRVRVDMHASVGQVCVVGGRALVESEALLIDDDGSDDLREGQAAPSPHSVPHLPQQYPKSKCVCCLQEQSSFSNMSLY